MNNGEDLAHVCFKDVTWLQTFPLNELSILDYFSLSQFYDRTCINEQLRMQTRFTTAAGQPTDAAGKIADMVGIEYVLSEARPPRLFIVTKRLRHGPEDVDVLGSYYVLDGTIYQSPSLLAILKCRLVSSLSYLTDAVKMATFEQTYDSSLKVYRSLEDPGATKNVTGNMSTTTPAELNALNAFLSLPLDKQ